MTAEFMESLRRRSANSSIVITRLTTCGRTLPFISLKTRSQLWIPSTSFISYPGWISSFGELDFRLARSILYDPRASRFEDSANFRHDPWAYISMCPPRSSIGDISRYDTHFSCRRYREGDRENRVLHSLISYRSPFMRDIGKDQREMRLHQSLLLDNPSRS